MRAFNSFCGLRRFAALKPHLARNTIALSEQAAQSVIEIAVKEPLYFQIGLKSLDFQYLSLQGNQKRSYQLHLIKATVNMCEVSIKHVLSPGAPNRAFWLARSRAPLWRSLPRDWSFVRRLLLAASFEVVLQPYRTWKHSGPKCGALSSTANLFSRKKPFKINTQTPRSTTAW